MEPVPHRATLRAPRANFAGFNAEANNQHQHFGACGRPSSPSLPPWPMQSCAPEPRSCSQKDVGAAAMCAVHPTGGRARQAAVSMPA